MSKQMNLTQEEAERIHALLPKGDALRSKIEVKYPLLRGMVGSWEELGSIEGYWVTDEECSVLHIDTVIEDEARNIYATRQQAQSHGIAAAMLSQLMKDLGDECVVDWYDESRHKWCIVLGKGEITLSGLVGTKSFLAFKTKSVAEEFMRLHLELIKEYWSF